MHTNTPGLLWKIAKCGHVFVFPQARMFQWLHLWAMTVDVTQYSCKTSYSWIRYLLVGGLLIYSMHSCFIFVNYMNFYSHCHQVSKIWMISRPVVTQYECKVTWSLFILWEFSKIRTEQGKVQKTDCVLSAVIWPLPGEL